MSPPQHQFFFFKKGPEKQKIHFLALAKLFPICWSILFYFYFSLRYIETHILGCVLKFTFFLEVVRTVGIQYKKTSKKTKVICNRDTVPHCNIMSLKKALTPFIKHTVFCNERAITINNVPKGICTDQKVSIP